MDLATIYDPISEDLDAVSRLLRDELSADDPFIGQLVAHVLQTKGKLLRPALVCLSALACGGGSGARLEVAGSVELIHVASLIHDDVIDAADLRRGQASVNALWGNQMAVLLGDYLFSKAFHILARLHSAELAAAVAGATVRMSQAEIKQIKHGNTAHTNEAIYFDIIEGKTARLFSAACQCGALTADASTAEAGALSEFGLEWGMAFQITDDALDLTASSDQVGKPIRSDIQTGKTTLPVIYALTHASDPDRRRLRDLIDSGVPASPSPRARSRQGRTNPREAPGPGRAAQQGDGQRGAAEEIAAILVRCGALDHALGVAKRRADRAAASLARIHASPARESLGSLVEFVTIRRH